jgi:hypothetical protein
LRNFMQIIHGYNNPSFSYCRTCCHNKWNHAWISHDLKFLGHGTKVQHPNQRKCDYVS